MSARGKRYDAARAAIDREKRYTPGEAIRVLKGTESAKFDETGERVAAALRGLPERQRAVVVLRHYQDMSLEEIAHALGMSLGTVKSSLHRALARMRTGLAGARP